MDNNRRAGLRADWYQHNIEGHCDRLFANGLVSKCPARKREYDKAEMAAQKMLTENSDTPQEHKAWIY